MNNRDIAKYAAMLATCVAVGVALPVFEDAADLVADAVDVINPFSWGSVTPHK